jgi:hypothetical protein
MLLSMLHAIVPVPLVNDNIFSWRISLTFSYLYFFKFVVSCIPHQVEIIYYPCRFYSFSVVTGPLRISVPGLWKNENTAFIHTILKWFIFSFSQIMFSSCYHSNLNSVLFTDTMPSACIIWYFGEELDRKRSLPISRYYFVSYFKRPSKIAKTSSQDVCSHGLIPSVSPQPSHYEVNGTVWLRSRRANENLQKILKVSLSFMWLGDTLDRCQSPQNIIVLLPVDNSS